MSYGNPQIIRRIGDVAAFAVGYGERGWFGNQAGLLRLVHQAPEGRTQADRTGSLSGFRTTYPIGAGIVW